MRERTLIKGHSELSCLHSWINVKLTTSQCNFFRFWTVFIVLFFPAPPVLPPHFQPLSPAFKLSLHFLISTWNRIPEDAPGLRPLLQTHTRADPCYSRFLLIINTIYVWTIEIHTKPISKSKRAKVPTLELTTVYKLEFTHFEFLDVCKYFLQKKDKNIHFYNRRIFLSNVSGQSLQVPYLEFSGSFGQWHSIL